MHVLYAPLCFKHIYTVEFLKDLIKYVILNKITFCNETTPTTNAFNQCSRVVTVLLNLHLPSK